MTDLKVILKTDSQGNKYLDVDNRKVEINSKTDPESITWTLDTSVTAQGGLFNDPKDPNPGFEWITRPRAGIFDRPHLSRDRLKLWLNDSHPDAGSKGEWNYILSATINSGPVQTRPERVETDTPMIKNN